MEASGPLARTCPACGASYPSDFAICPRDATPLADSKPGGDPLVGAVLGGTYKIARVLGEGGMARLYEAEHVRLGRKLAVKVIHDDLAGSPQLLARFEREARAAASIRSPHIVEVYDVLRTHDGRPCLVAELLEGEDLEDHALRVGKLAPAEAIRIARQICRAMHVAHEHGVVHRDLKPSNVFLCRTDGGEPVVKVLDFGVAKLSDGAELTRTGAVVGTPAYMAPEQARRASEAGPRADVYSVGAVLYRLLTGQPPYGHDPPVNPLLLLLEEEPVRPREIDPSIPEGLEAVIQRAMARDPEARPDGALALDAELAAFEPAATGAGPAARSTAAASSSLTITIERSARWARPLAAAWAGIATVSTGLFVAALLSDVLVARRESERVLTALTALAASIGVGVLLHRWLRARWRSAPAVAGAARAIVRVATAGLCGFAILELVAHAGVARIGLATRLVASALVGGFAGLAPRLVSAWTRRHDGDS